MSIVVPWHSPSCPGSDMSTSTSVHDWVRQAADTIRVARDAKTPLVIEGHGSKRFYGQPAAPDHRVLSTTAYRGIVDYDPTELVVVVRSGTPITELEHLLAQSHQMLAFEPPRFNGQGTVGGMMATGLSGPRRASAGAAKDFVLGMTVLDDQGTPMRYGGTVMKNVAGYDMSRLHTGALGTLGLIVDISIKVLPVSPAEMTLQFECNADRCLEWVNAWAGQPLPIVSTSWHGRHDRGQLHVRLAGAVAAVNAAAEKLGGHRMPQELAQTFWSSLRDHDHDFFQVTAAAPATSLWRLSVPSIAPHFQEFNDAQWVEWGGALRWIKTDMPAERVRALARQVGGHATLFRSWAPECRARDGAFTPLAPALLKIHQRIKRELDGQGIFNPGRLVPGL